MLMYQHPRLQRICFKGKYFSGRVAYTFCPEEMTGTPYKHFFIRELQGADIFLLSDKEKRIASLCANGLCAKEIAGLISLSTSAVNFHIKRFTEKTHSSNKTEAVAKIICYGMLLR